MKTLNLITSLMAVAAASLLSFSCEKQEEELIVPLRRRKPRLKIPHPCSFRRPGFH